jgi:sulfite exporter TauE/SafE/copper chaperone CopZ
MDFQEKQFKKYKFHVKGMHCNSCVILIEDKLKDFSNIKNAEVSLKNNSVEILADFGDKEIIDIADELSNELKHFGYALVFEQENMLKNWSDFKLAIPLALLVILLFVGLQKIGIINLVNVNEITFGTAFVIGVIASLSTCMASVGALVLSTSATFAKGGDKIKPQVLFHLGRLLSFFVLGGVIGIVGTFFKINIWSNFILGILVGLVMLILGINLLDIFHNAKKFQFVMPKFISKSALKFSKINHTLTSFLFGIITFFLPCGFTQSMQIYALSTGSFSAGALIMSAFALGTLPVLAVISFSSLKVTKKGSGIFFKTVGLIVILFAFFNILNSLSAIGIIPSLFNF